MLFCFESPTNIMVCHKVSVIFSFFVFYIQSTYSDDFAEDYYFGGNILRLLTKPRTCHDETTKFICQLKCGRNHVCVQDVCYCLEFDDVEGENPSNEDAYEQPLNFDNFDEMTLKKKKFKNTHVNEYSQQPILRHHIAHFCPNLEVARQCIKKCMALGKPAFCGKDHVCYCGYKTKNALSIKQIDVEGMQNNFKDMNKKYLGRHRNEKQDVTMTDRGSDSRERNEDTGT